MSPLEPRMLSVILDLPSEEKENEGLWSEYFTADEENGTYLSVVVEVDRVIRDISPGMLPTLGLIPATPIVTTYKVSLVDKSEIPEKKIFSQSYRIGETWGSTNTIRRAVGKTVSFEEALKQLVSRASFDISRQLEKHNQTLHPTPGAAPLP